MVALRARSLAPRLRLGAAIALAAACLATSVSCGGSQRSGGGGVLKNDAVIRVDTTVSTARVLVNDRDLGTIEILRRGIALSPGTHRLEVRHPNFHTHYELLVLSKKERRIIKVELAERLP